MVIIFATVDKLTYKFTICESFMSLCYWCFFQARQVIVGLLI